MRELFEALSHAVQGAPLVAVGAAFIWGILSVILSPCHLATIPLIVAFVGGQGRVSTRRAFALSSLFALGILITIGVIGVVTAAAGGIVGNLGGWGNYAVATVLFAVGLHLLDVIPMPWSGPGQVDFKRKGPIAAFILGLVYGIALGPCTFAYLATILSLTLRVASASRAQGFLLLTVYGVGHCAVLVMAGTSTELVQRWLKWGETSKGPVILRKVCGVLVLLGGLWLIYLA